MWAPERFDERRRAAREKVQEHRKLLGRQPIRGEDGDGEGS
jgi:hypothetical protein